MVHVLINGCNGNMGKVLEHCIKKTTDMVVEYKIDRDTDVSFSSLNHISNKPDVIIDFSTPTACLVALDYATSHLIPVVIATTGFTDIENSKILEYSQAIPIFKSSNMSYTIHLLGKILKTISPAFSSMNIEIIEKHHNRKKDAPSRNSTFLGWLH